MAVAPNIAPGGDLVNALQPRLLVLPAAVLLGLIVMGCDRRSATKMPAATTTATAPAMPTQTTISTTASAKQQEALSVAQHLHPDSEFAPAEAVLFDEATGEYRVRFKRMVVPAITASRPDLTGIGPEEVAKMQAQLDATAKDMTVYVHLRPDADGWLYVGTSGNGEIERPNKPFRVR